MGGRRVNKAFAIAFAAVLAGCGAGVVEGDPDLGSTRGSAQRPAGGDDDTPQSPGDDDAPVTPTDDGPGGDPPPPPQEPDRIPVFIATGHMQRTVMSCDGGQTWRADQSADDEARCWTTESDPHYVECDHNPGAARGITFTGTAFVATFGWGPPGGIYRSLDGVMWTPSVTGTTFGGVEAGAGRVVAMSAVPRVSNDDGVSFTSSDVYIDQQARRTGFAAYGAGRFLMVGDGEISLSSDVGTSWWSPDVWPSGCGDNIQTQGGVAYGDGVILVVGGNGLACRSRDGGATWTTRDIGTSNVDSQLVWTGTHFRVWSAGIAYASPDGDAWSSTPTVPAGVSIGPVAYDAEHGIYAAVSGGWNEWYDAQRFYRSVDGITWQVLAASDAPRGHPMRNMVFGYAARSVVCP